MRALIILAALALANPVHAAPLQVLTENNPPFNFAEGKDVKGTSTEAVRSLLAKAGVEATIAVLPWDEAYSRAQRSANACVYGTARVENREKLFKWYGPVGGNVWAALRPPVLRQEDRDGPGRAFLPDRRREERRQSGLHTRSKKGEQEG